MKTFLLCRAALCAAAIVATAVRAAPTPTASSEKELMAVLASNADRKAKSDACRELGRIGTAASVPALAALLPVPELSHMARVALEMIPDRAAGEALLAAVDSTEGMARIGVIDSLGRRREAAAVPLLTARLNDADPAVAAAAARSLGWIGGEGAVRALRQAMPKAPAPLRAIMADALLRCAETAGDQTAREIYDELRSEATPAPARLAAWRSIIAGSGPEEGAKLIVDTLRGTNAADAAIALRAAYELPGSDATRRLAAALPLLPESVRPAMIEVLAVRGDPASAPALLAAAQNGDTPGRLAAIRALVRIGAESAVPTLASMALETDPELAAGARAALASMPGARATAAILSLLDHTNAAVRATAVEMIAHRFPSDAGTRLLGAAADSDAAVRKAALRALRAAASPRDVPALLDLLRSAKADEVGEVEAALSALIAREVRKTSAPVRIVKAIYGDLPDGPAADVTQKVSEKVHGGELALTADNRSFRDPAPGRVKQLSVTFTSDGGTVTRTVNEGETLVLPPVTADPPCLEPILQALPSAAPATRTALLRVVAVGGGPRAFDAVRAAMQDEDPAARGTAARLLAEWPTPRALPVLREMARDAKDTAVALLALRGALRLAPRTGEPPEAQLAVLDSLAALITRDEERKLLLAALGEIPSPAALERVMAHIGSPALKAEAAAAAVQIAEKIAAAYPDAVAAAMKTARTAAEDRSIVRRASVLIRKTQDR